ncbi:hypothetical protein BDN72DRAFT_863755 [Pluteus cervinus]|uniref:Uncharacterized protein n=1 Tax=Pluteus cervinus TaxID=181527 RepID=A0ACD3A6F7_9AGAR|nr:hypothetical protein BDN72DRAFT_863755 [Pluteus cervinus]
MDSDMGGIDHDIDDATGTGPETVPSTSDGAKIKKGPLRTWLLDREEFLVEDIHREGRLGHTYVCCPGCSLSSETPSYRCKECEGNQLFCRNCILGCHQYNGLHLIEAVARVRVIREGFRKGVAGVRVWVGTHQPVHPSGHPPPKAAATAALVPCVAIVIGVVVQFSTKESPPTFNGSANLYPNHNFNLNHNYLLAMSSRPARIITPTYKRQQQDESEDRVRKRPKTSTSTATRDDTMPPPPPPSRSDTGSQVSTQAQSSANKSATVPATSSLSQVKSTQKALEPQRTAQKGFRPPQLGTIQKKSVSKKKKDIVEVEDSENGSDDDNKAKKDSEVEEEPEWDIGMCSSRCFHT